MGLRPLIREHCVFLNRSIWRSLALLPARRSRVLVWGENAIVDLGLILS
ncbi:MAG: hypothetical protein AAGA60_32255 [Cyanobacteria bacterium P01_E01_bin.42]